MSCWDLLLLDPSHGVARLVQISGSYPKR
jgi:hypothetical protein